MRYPAKHSLGVSRFPKLALDAEHLKMLSHICSVFFFSEKLWITLSFELSHVGCKINSKHICHGILSAKEQLYVTNFIELCIFGWRYPDTLSMRYLAKHFLCVIQKNTLYKVSG